MWKLSHSLNARTHVRGCSGRRTTPKALGGRSACGRTGRPLALRWAYPNGHTRWCSVYRPVAHVVRRFHTRVQRERAHSKHPGQEVALPLGTGSGSVEIGLGPVPAPLSRHQHPPPRALPPPPPRQPSAPVPARVSCESEQCDIRARLPPEGSTGLAGVFTRPAGLPHQLPRGTDGSTYLLARLRVTAGCFVHGQ